MNYVDLQDLTDEQREAFVQGWKDAGGYMGDSDSPNPWCCPWYWGEDHTWFKGTTPEEWGAEWWEECQGQIREELWFESLNEEEEEED